MSTAFRSHWPAALLTLFALAWGSATSAAAAVKAVRYEADAPHSQVGFTARYMGVVDVHGSFSDFRGTLLYVPGNPARSTVSVVIDAGSIDTGNKTRDKDLRGGDFFDAARFPKLRFTSTSVEQRGDVLAVTGDLTIRSVTRSVVLNVETIHPPMQDALGSSRVGFVGRTRVSRLDYGVVGSKFWNNEFAPGRFAIGDSVEIALTLEGKIDDLDRRKADASRKRPLVDSLAALGRSRDAAAVGKALRDARAAGVYDVSAGALLLAGGRLLMHEATSAAIEVFKQAAEMYPNSAECHAQLAEACMAAGQREVAIQSSTRALALDPWHTSARETLRWMRGDQP
jgi:polyisoprenoid-binding protein YceI